MEAFATSPHGLGLTPERFWWLSWPQYRAHIRVWKRQQDNHREQWAHVMAAIHNAWLRPEGHPQYTPEHWTGKKPKKYTGITKDSTPEEIHRIMRGGKSVEEQRMSIRASLEFAAAFNQARQEQGMSVEPN